MLKHLVDWLPMTFPPMHVYGAVVSDNVGNVFWERSMLICQQTECLFGVILLLHGKKEYSPAFPEPVDMWAFLIPYSISQINIEEPGVKERLVQTVHWVINTIRHWHDCSLYYPLGSPFQPLLGACMRDFISGSRYSKMGTYSGNKVCLKVTGYR